MTSAGGGYFAGNVRRFKYTSWKICETSQTNAVYDFVFSVDLPRPWQSWPLWFNVRFTNWGQRIPLRYCSNSLVWKKKKKTLNKFLFPLDLVRARDQASWSCLVSCRRRRKGWRCGVRLKWVCLSNLPSTLESHVSFRVSYSRATQRRIVL